MLARAIGSRTQKRTWAKGLVLLLPYAGRGAQRLPAMIDRIGSGDFGIGHYAIFCDAVRASGICWVMQMPCNVENDGCGYGFALPCVVSCGGGNPAIQAMISEMGNGLRRCRMPCDSNRLIDPGWPVKSSTRVP